MFMYYASNENYNFIYIKEEWDLMKFCQAYMLLEDKQRRHWRLHVLVAGGFAASQGGKLEAVSTASMAKILKRECKNY